MYVLGGEEGLDRHHDTIEVYDPDSDTWSISGYLTSSRSWLSAATLSIRYIWILVAEAGYALLPYPSGTSGYL